MNKSWTLFFDGSCEPYNPGGTAAFGWVLYSPKGELVDSSSGIICSGEGATNNVAELGALEYGIKAFIGKELNGRLSIRGDSLLAINLVNRKWRCRKEHLVLYLKRIFSLLEGIKWEAQWIPREQNEEADNLSVAHNGGRDKRVFSANARAMGKAGKKAAFGHSPTKR